MNEFSYDNFKVLIIGAGITGERHARAQKDVGTNVTLYDIASKKALEKAQALGIDSQVNLSSAIANSDLVYITTPDHLHTEIAADAIKAGKDVFCEKPLTTSLADALELQQLVHQFGTRFIVGHYYRLTPTFMAAKQAMEQDDIGRVMSIYATYLHDMRPLLALTPWRINQDFLFGGGVHAIDIISWLADEPTTAVYASTGVKTDPGFPLPEDYRLNLKFQSGLQTHVWLNARAQRPEHGTDLEVYGDQGAIITHNKWKVLKIFRAGEKNYSEVPADSLEKPVDIVAKTINAYLTGKQSDHHPLPNIDQAIPIMKILDAAQRSIKIHTEILL